MKNENKSYNVQRSSYNTGKMVYMITTTAVLEDWSL